MPSRPDIRDLASNVHDAFADCEREQLLDILTFVLKEYVVEGPPPMLVHQAETLADLKGATFAQLISAMQTRFDFPELAMFVVDGEQVSVRVGGVVQPLIAQRQALTGAGAPPSDPPPTARPQPGVRVVETTLQQRPAPGPIAQALASAATERSGSERPAASAPPPVRGLSLRGRPAGDAGAPAAPEAAAPAAPPAAPAAAAPSAVPEKKESGDDATARFSLLELD